MGQTPSTAACLIGDDKVALAAGVRADAVKDAPECRLTWQEAGVMVGFPPPPDKQVTPDNLFQYPFVRGTLQNTSRVARTASYEQGDIAAWKNGNFKNNPVITSYRSYWYQVGGEDHALMGLGVFGQGRYINPDRPIVSVRFSSLGPCRQRVLERVE